MSHDWTGQWYHAEQRNQLASLQKAPKTPTAFFWGLFFPLLPWAVSISLKATFWKMLIPDNVLLCPGTDSADGLAVFTPRLVHWASDNFSFE